MKKELEKILEDEKFVKELMLKKTRDEAKKAIEEKGVSVTDDEMEEIYKFYSAIYEKCKEMKKEDLEKIAGGGRGIKKFFSDLWYGDVVSRNTGGLANNRDALKLAGSVFNALAQGAKMVGGYFSDRQEENEFQRELELGKQDIQKQQLALENKKQNLMIGAVGVAAAAGLVYTFKDDIRSWIKGKKQI